MAGVALNCRMGPQQGKPVVVVLNRLDGNVPALHRVTLLAARAHLPAMDVGMAIRALSADVREYHLGVALSAGHAFVHPPQGVTRFVVIKFRDSSNWLPSQSGMAILAGHVEAAMRASGLDGPLRLSTGRSWQRCQQGKNQADQNSRDQSAPPR